MSYPRPAVDVTNQAKMKNSDPPIYISSPSTSKEPDRSQQPEETDAVINSLPHIIPLSSNGNTGTVKFIQVSPIKSFPDKKIPNLKLCKNPVAGLNLNSFPKFEMSKKALGASNVKILTPVTTVKTPTGKIAGPFLEVHPKSPDKRIGMNLVTCTSFPIGNRTSVPVSQPMESLSKKTTTIPNVLRKRALLDSPLKSPEIVPNNTTDLVDPTNTISNISAGQDVVDNATSLETKDNPNNVTVKEKTNTELKNPKEKQSVKQKAKDKPLKCKEEKNKEVKSKKDNLPPKTKDKSSKTKDLLTSKPKDVPKKKMSKETRDAMIVEGSLYIADGFKEDVENLLEKCSQVSNLNFEKFCDIWKQMDFPNIFHGRQSGAEVAELSEEVIHIAKGYMLASNASFEENVAGLFLVYALLNHQPFPGFASLRLVPSDVPFILNLQAEARRRKRHDVLYVLGHVLIKGPCQFHVLARETSMEIPIKKYYDGTVPVANNMDNVISRNAECVPHFKELISLEQRYQAMRQKLREQHAGKDKVSNLCKRPAAKLFELYRAHIPRGRHSDRSAEELVNEILSTSKPEEERADLLASIKQRAMTNVVDNMRHLTAVARQDSSSSSSDESEIEMKPNNKPKANYRGRSTAAMLQELFAVQEHSDDDFVPKPSTNEMPALDDTDNITEPKEPTTKQTGKKPAKKSNTDDVTAPKETKQSKKAKKAKTENDDTKNNNQPNKKLRNVVDGPAVKRKATKNNKAKNKLPDTEGSTSKGSIDSELGNSEEAKSINMTESISNIIESTNQEASDMPAIIIEIERDDDVKMTSLDSMSAKSNEENKCEVAKSTKVVSNKTKTVNTNNVDIVNKKSKKANNAKSDLAKNCKKAPRNKVAIQNDVTTKDVDKTSESSNEIKEESKPKKSKAKKGSSKSSVENKEGIDVINKEGPEKTTQKRRKKPKETNAPKDLPSLEIMAPEGKIRQKEDAFKNMSNPEKNAPKRRKNPKEKILTSFETMTPKNKTTEEEELKNISNPKKMVQKRNKKPKGINAPEDLPKTEEGDESKNFSNPEKMAPKRKRKPKATNAPENLSNLETIPPKNKITEGNELKNMSSIDKITSTKRKKKTKESNTPEDMPRLEPMTPKNTITEAEDDVKNMSSTDKKASTKRKKKPKESNAPEDMPRLEPMTPTDTISEENKLKNMYSTDKITTPKRKKKPMETNAPEDMPNLEMSPKTKVADEKDDPKSISSPKTLPPKKRKIIPESNEFQNVPSPEKTTPKRRKLHENTESLNTPSLETLTPDKRKVTKESSKSKNDMTSPEKITPKKNESLDLEVQTPNSRRASPRVRILSNSVVKRKSPRTR